MTERLGRCNKRDGLTCLLLRWTVLSRVGCEIFCQNRQQAFRAGRCTQTVAHILTAQSARYLGQCAQMRAAGIERREQHNDQINRAFINRVIINRCVQPGEDGVDFFNSFNPRMWQGNTIADTGRAQSFPFHGRGHDFPEIKCFVFQAFCVQQGSAHLLEELFFTGAMYVAYHAVRVKECFLLHGNHRSISIR